MPKLSIELDLKGGETAAQKFRDLNKEVVSLQNNLKRGISFGDLSKATGGNFSASTLAKNPQLAALLNKSTVSAIDPRFEAMQQLARRGSSQAMIDLQAQIAQGDYRLNNYTGKVPPVIKSGGFGGLVPPRLRTLLGGIGGGGSGGGGSAFTQALLPVLGALAAFRVALYTLEPVIRAFRLALHQLMESIQQGAKLYTDAAKLGLSPGRTGALQFASGQLGISTKEAQEMILASEFRRGNRTGGSVTRNATTTFRNSTTVAGGQIFGTNGRLNQLGDQQKLNNLQQEFNYLLKQSENDWQEIGSNARVLFFTSSKIKLMLLEWETVFSDIATDLSLFVQVFADFGRMLAQLVQLMMKGGFLELSGRVSKGLFGQPDFKQQLPMSNQPFQLNQFQRMGFVMNGGFNVQGDAGKRTAKATEKSAELLERIAASVGADAGMAVGNATLGMMP